MEFLDRRDGAPFDLVDMEVATRMAVATTAVARASSVDREAGQLLRTALAAIAAAGDGALGDAAVEALVGEVTERLSTDDPLWRLADRIGRLRAADPDDIELVIDWLDALLARTERRTQARRRRP
jgi:hypothetical protein